MMVGTVRERPRGKDSCGQSWLTDPTTPAPHACGRGCGMSAPQPSSGLWGCGIGFGRGFDDVIQNASWAELCPPSSYVEVLMPRTSECDCLEKQSLEGDLG